MTLFLVDFTFLNSTFLLSFFHVFGDLVLIVK